MRAMHHIVIRKPGGYDRLLIEEVPTPAPKAGEVRIAVRAIGINYADCMVRMGLYKSARELVGYPITPGFEVAGVVEALGPGADGFSVGDQVFGITLFNGYGSHICLPQSQVFAVPAGWSYSQAAAFPAVHLTAYFALFELAHPRAGDRLLVHSAAGGVGSALVRLGKLAGLHVTGVVGASHKLNALRALGADEIIDKSREDLWQRTRAIAPQGFAVILDANGASTLKQSYAHLAMPGKLVVYGFHSMLPKASGKPNWLKLAWDYLRTPRINPLDITGANRSVLGFNLSFIGHRSDLLLEAMHRLLGWVEAGRLPPPQVSEYPFGEVARAQRELESGETTGKLVLVLNQ